MRNPDFDSVLLRFGQPRRMGRILLAVCLALVPFTHAHADMLNLTGAETAPNIAEITILDDRVNVRLEVYVGDLEYFDDLIPDDMLKEGGADRPSHGHHEMAGRVQRNRCDEERRSAS